MIRYSRDNIYVKYNPKDKTAYLGISEQHASSFADPTDAIESISMPELGQISIKDEFVTIEASSKSEVFYCPISGNITEINEDVVSSLDLLLDEPEGAGWLCKIENVDKDEFDELFNHEEYVNFYNENSSDETRQYNDMEDFDDEEFTPNDEDDD
jgi:glycine cleavage system H protein